MTHRSRRKFTPRRHGATQIHDSEGFRRGGVASWREFLLILCLGLMPACVPHARLILPDPIRSESIDALLERNPLAAGENIKALPLQAGEHSSVTLVQIRDREPPHRHTRYDIMVTLVRGKGTLHIGDRALPMQAGDSSFITKGTPHYFVNAGAEPAAALVTFAPAFSGPDQAPVD